MQIVQKGSQNDSTSCEEGRCHRRAKKERETGAEEERKERTRKATGKYTVW